MNREKERIEEGKDEEEGMMPKSAVYNEKNRKNINDFLFNDEEQQEYDDENNREGEMNKSISLFNRKMYLRDQMKREKQKLKEQNYSFDQQPKSMRHKSGKGRKNNEPKESFFGEEVEFYKEDGGE